MVKNEKGNNLYSKPKYNHALEGNNGLYVPGPEIYIIPNPYQVYPIFIGNVNKNTFIT